MAAVTQILRFSSPDALGDLGRFATRAATFDSDGAIRLQTSGTVLAAWVGIVAGTGILGEGAVLGLRTFALAEPAEPGELDVAVPLRAIIDRTARGVYAGSELHVPPTEALAPWAALTPPRSGWELVGEIDADLLAEVGQSGIAEVTVALAERGAAAGFARDRIWSRPIREVVRPGAVDAETGPLDGSSGVTPGVGEMRAGGALAAYGLGFLRPGSTVGVHRCGRWTRLSAVGGYVLMR